MSTFEEKYRKKTGTAETPQPTAMQVLQAAASTEEYKAFNSVAHPEFELWIRTNNANESGDVYLPYSLRNHMISDGNGFVISMHFNTPILSVRIHGRNLQELVHKLSKREVEWIMEYDPRKWAEVPEGAPCITGIDVRHAPVPAKNGGEEPEPELKQGPESTATH